MSEIGLPRVADEIGCRTLTLVLMQDDLRRKGIARELYKLVEAVSPIRGRPTGVTTGHRARW